MRRAKESLTSSESRDTRAPRFWLFHLCIAEEAPAFWSTPRSKATVIHQDKHNDRSRSSCRQMRHAKRDIRYYFGSDARARDTYLWRHCYFTLLYLQKTSITIPPLIWTTTTNGSTESRFALGSNAIKEVHCLIGERHQFECTISLLRCSRQASNQESEMTPCLDEIIGRLSTISGDSRYIQDHQYTAMFEILSHSPLKSFCEAKPYL